MEYAGALYASVFVVDGLDDTDAAVENGRVSGTSLKFFIDIVSEIQLFGPWLACKRETRTMYEFTH